MAEWRNFQWDDDKNAANIRKHRVSLATAARIFDGPVLTMIDEREVYGELRETSLGMVGVATILLVVHTDREGICRLISARPATSTERKRYEQALRQGQAT